MLSSLLTTIIDLLCAYGRWGAGLPSCHGSYEPAVPKELQKEFGDAESQGSD